MAELLASKVAIEEEEAQLVSIPGVATSVIGACGVAERGPIGDATLCTSWDEYVRVFGSYTADGELPMAIRGIYRQDPGAYVYVVRTVHYTNPATPATKTSAAATIMAQGTSATAAAGAVTSAQQATFNLAPNQTLDIHCDEDVGGPDTATFTATQATIAGVAPAIAAMLNKTVIFNVDNGDSQTVTFTAGAVDVGTSLAELNAHSSGCYWVDDGAGNIDVFSDTFGSDSEVDITGGTGLVEIGHAIATSAATGDPVANIDTVTFTEAKTIIEAAVTNPATSVVVTQEATNEITITSGTTGAASSVQVEVTSTAVGFGFDNVLHSGSASSLVNTLQINGKTDGTYAHALRAVIAAATNGESDHFNFTITDSAGRALEVFPNVQNTDDTAVDFIEDVVNLDVDDGGSRYLNVVDQAVVGGLRPDNGTLTPAAGDDGLTLIVDADYLGDEAGGTGLHALNLIEDIRLVLIPGGATSAIHNGQITYVETTREGSAFAILDPPAGLTAAQMVTYVETTAAILELSEFASINWPRIKVLNPSRTVYGNTEQITVPPAAWVCGAESREDRATLDGKFKAAAGITRGRIFGCLGFETDEVLDERKRDLVYPKRINPISKETGTPRFIDGTRSLKSTGAFPSIPERRTVIFIEQSVKQGTRFARHSNNDSSLRARVFRSVFQFLKTQMKLGAFRTKNTDTAFFLDVSDSLNSPSVIFQNKLVGRIGLATQKPVDWVIFSFSQDTRALLEELSS